MGVKIETEIKKRVGEEAIGELYERELVGKEIKIENMEKKMDIEEELREETNERIEGGEKGLTNGFYFEYVIEKENRKKNIIETKKGEDQRLEQVILWASEYGFEDDFVGNKKKERRKSERIKDKKKKGERLKSIWRKEKKRMMKLGEKGKNTCRKWKNRGSKKWPEKWDVDPWNLKI